MKISACFSKPPSLLRKFKSENILLIFFLAAGSFASFPIFAVNSLPSKGAAEYTTIYSGTVLSTMELMSDRVVELREIVGFTQSEIESGHYGALSARCLVYFESTASAPLINGSCTLMDGDGDEIHQRFGSGKIAILGGTGKYSGIDGSGTITNVRYIRAQTGNSRQFEVSHQIEWLIE